MSCLSKVLSHFLRSVLRGFSLLVLYEILDTDSLPPLVLFLGGPSFVGALLQRTPPEVFFNSPLRPLPGWVCGIALCLCCHSMISQFSLSASWAIVGSSASSSTRSPAFSRVSDGRVVVRCGALLRWQLGSLTCASKVDVHGPIIGRHISTNWTVGGHRAR